MSKKLGQKTDSKELHDKKTWLKKTQSKNLVKKNCVKKTQQNPDKNKTNTLLTISKINEF